jgi:hypothetical protein
MTQCYVGIADCPSCGTHWLSTADATVVCTACRAERAPSASAASAVDVAYLQSRHTGDETSDADPGLERQPHPPHTPYQEDHICAPTTDCSVPSIC